ncbi:MAG: copper resistance protein B [Hyphomicrobiaceae bacterium]
MLVGLAGTARAQQTPTADQAQPQRIPKLLDTAIFAHLLIDQLEGRFGFNQGNTFRWEAAGWVGTDENRVWLLSEGRYSDNELDDGIQQLFYGRAITTYFDALVGTRWDLDSLPTRGWGAIGIQGLAPQFFQVSAIGYIGGDGRLAARLEASYDLLITQRLILQPQFEMNFYTKDDPARLIGAGLSELDVGLRLRYEITRQFAPYIGITYFGQYGATASYVSTAGGSTQQMRFTVGLRTWF